MENTSIFKFGVFLNIGGTFFHFFQLLQAGRVLIQVCPIFEGKPVKIGSWWYLQKQVSTGRVTNNLTE